MRAHPACADPQPGTGQPPTRRSARRSRRWVMIAPRDDRTLRAKPDAVGVRGGRRGPCRAARATSTPPTSASTSAHVVEGERLVTHHFACTRRGYAGWRWSVTVARAPRQKTVTVDEVVLIPGDEAIVAPQWVPYRERIQPGDLSPGDLLPVEPTTTRGWCRRTPSATTRSTPTRRPRSAHVAHELGLGRVRTLSLEGRDARRPALVRRRRRPRLPARPGRRPTTAAAAASWSASPARWPTPSASAPTATPTTTAGWSPSTTAAAPTPRSGWPRSTSPSRCPSPCTTPSTTTRSRASEPRSARSRLDVVATPPNGRDTRSSRVSRPRRPSVPVRLRRRGRLAAAAVLQAEEAEAEAGQAGPQPPGAAVVRERALEGQQREEAEEPDREADLRPCGRRRRRGARRRPRCRCGCRSRAGPARAAAPRRHRNPRDRCQARRAWFSSRE